MLAPQCFFLMLVKSILTHIVHNFYPLAHLEYQEPWGNIC